MDTRFTAAITVLVVYLYRGFVFSVLWGWFVSKPFGLPTINIPQALGLVVFFLLIVGEKTKPERASWLAVLVGSLLSTTTVLAMGFIISLFV